MLEMKSRHILDKDSKCCLCGTELAKNEEAYGGYLQESSDMLLLCDRCECLESSIPSLLLGKGGTDLLNALLDINYLKCDCGADITDVKYRISKDTITVKCSKCGKKTEFPITREALLSYMLSNDGNYGINILNTDDMLNDTEDEETEDDFSYLFTDEELAKYTDDYTPDISFRATKGATNSLN